MMVKLAPADEKEDRQHSAKTSHKMWNVARDKKKGTLSRREKKIRAGELLHCAEIKWLLTQLFRKKKEPQNLNESNQAPARIE